MSNPEAPAVSPSTSTPTPTPAGGAVRRPMPSFLSSSLRVFDLSLSLRAEPRGVHGRMDYRTDLFDGETVRRMLEQRQSGVALKSLG